MQATVQNFFGGFYVRTPQSFDLSLGESVMIKMYGSGSQSVALGFSGKSIPGEKVMQKVLVKMPNIDLQSYYLRVKSYVGESDSAQMEGFDLWEKSEDGYYYYQGSVVQFQEIGICTSVKIPENISLKPNMSYCFIFTVELLEK